MYFGYIINEILLKIAPSYKIQHRSAMNNTYVNIFIYVIDEKLYSPIVNCTDVRFCIYLIDKLLIFLFLLIM